MVKVLKHQLDDAEAKKLLKRAVYLFSIGGNDYLHFYDENTNTSQSEKKEYVGIVIGNLTIALKVRTCFPCFSTTCDLTFGLDDDFLYFFCRKYMDLEVERLHFRTQGFWVVYPPRDPAPKMVPALKNPRHWHDYTTWLLPKPSRN